MKKFKKKYNFPSEIIPGSLICSLAAACTDPAGLLPTH